MGDLTREEAVAAVNAATVALPPRPDQDAPESVWDAYVDARNDLADARAALADVEERRMRAYVATIRRA